MGKLERPFWRIRPLFFLSKNGRNNLAALYGNTGAQKRRIGYCTISPKQRKRIQRIKNNKIANTRQTT